ncbi:MAG TPA: GC-type dockerin domain-anchored protein [Phycisphaerales bacterium]|nr:GC-type dockerin domain-anchored protein [Planctomycetota bacterium]HZW08557.1 GC-type dockerin domain-anchored protein [Phycisphaerales bacterium]
MRCALAAILFAALGAAAHAQCTDTELARITDPNGEFGRDQFGRSVSLSGDGLLIGEPGQSRAHVFRLGDAGWSHEQVIVQHTDDTLDFGTSVALQGGLAVIGASVDYDTCNDPDDCTQGAAWVFRHNGAFWQQEARLPPPFYIDSFGFYGQVVALDGTTAMVAAPRSLNGVVVPYRFDGTQWERFQPLEASDGMEGDNFGAAVAVDVPHAVVGAPNSDGAGERSGSAYVFERNRFLNWVQVSRLAPTDLGPDDRFGSAVAIRGDLIAVGAPGPGINFPTHTGAVYLYGPRSGGWSLLEKLVPGDAQLGDAFGYSVSIPREDIIVVGALTAAANGHSAGAAYVFRKIGAEWVEQARLTASDPADDQFFGISASADGELAAIGAPETFNGGGGAAYAFGGISDCNGNGTLDLCDVAAGSSDDLDGDGVPDECECRADFNGDGQVNTQDVIAFLNAWNADDSAADFNGDGQINTQDVIAFLNAWNIGC